MILRRIYAWLLPIEMGFIEPFRIFTVPMYGDDLLTGERVILKSWSRNAMIVAAKFGR